MNSKTPVSLLQEYTAKHIRCLPDYTPGASDSPDYAFKCTVKVGDLVAAGYGTTKQAAKHKSAQKALEKLGVYIQLDDDNNNSVKTVSSLQPLYTETSKTQVNYVGILNELASTNRKTYADYHETPSLGPFEVTCSFLQWKTSAVAGNKKAAKQEAAQKMLQL